MEIKYAVIGLIVGLVASFFLRKTNVPVGQDLASQLRNR